MKKIIFMLSMMVLFIPPVANADLVLGWTEAEYIVDSYSTSLDVSGNWEELSSGGGTTNVTFVGSNLLDLDPGEGFILGLNTSLNPNPMAAIELTIDLVNNTNFEMQYTSRFDMFATIDITSSTSNPKDWTYIVQGYNDGNLEVFELFSGSKEGSYFEEKWMIPVSVQMTTIIAANSSATQNFVYNAGTSGNTMAVPEPSGLLLFGAPFVYMLTRRRRKPS